MEAGDGEEALQVCQANQDQEIQLLVTDMVMPRMSGGELITEMSSSRPEKKLLGAFRWIWVVSGGVTFSRDFGLSGRTSRGIKMYVARTRSWAVLRRL